MEGYEIGNDGNRRGMEARNKNERNG